MSLKTKFFPVITLAFAVVAFSTFVSAQETTTSPDAIKKYEKRERKGFGKHGDNGKGMRGGRHFGMRGLRGIDLTDAQKEQLRAIHESNRPSEETRKEMHTLMLAKREGTITPEQQERLKALKMQAREKGKQIHEQVLAILTPEQRQQLEARKAEMRKKREERRQMREQNKTAPDKPMDN